LSVDAQLMFQAMKKQHRIWWIWCTSTNSQYNDREHTEFIITYLCMHPVYDNIQDKITWFIQGVAKKVHH